MDDANAPEPAQVEPSGDHSPTPPIPIDRTEIDRSPRTDRDSLAPGGLEGTPGSEALAAFLRFHPFMAFFIWLSDVQYSGAHQRVAGRAMCGGGLLPAGAGADQRHAAKGIGVAGQKGAPAV